MIGIKIKIFGLWKVIIFKNINKQKINNTNREERVFDVCGTVEIVVLEVCFGDVWWEKSIFLAGFGTTPEVVFDYNKSII